MTPEQLTDNNLIKKDKYKLEKERVTMMINNGCGVNYSWSRSEIKTIRHFNLLNFK